MCTCTVGSASILGEWSMALVLYDCSCFSIIIALQCLIFGAFVPSIFIVTYSFVSPNAVYIPHIINKKLVIQTESDKITLQKHPMIVCALLTPTFLTVA